MSPRNKVSNKITGLLLFLFLFFFVCSPGYCDKNPVIDFYQQHISAVDGNRCPMYPSCSSYAGQAIEKHGAVIGSIMALDRLIRCGRDEAKISPTYHIDEQTFIFDPVQANDFWWFNKENKQ